jgi:hypothetical protein
LYYGTGAVSGTGAPSVTNYQPFGGTSFFGPAVGSVEGVPTVVATGTDGMLYQRTPASGWQAFGGTRCTGHPAIASRDGTAFLACHGGDGALWFSADSGTGFGGFSSAGGRVIDGPGLAAHGDHAVVAVEGTDGTTWACRINADGSARGFAGYGGRLLHGTGATSLA